MEAGIVDHDHRIGPMRTQEACGPFQQAREKRDAAQDRPQTHEGGLAERIQEVAAGLGHALAAETRDLDSGLPGVQRSNQIGSVQIAARLPGADEQSHGRHPVE